MNRKSVFSKAALAVMLALCLTLTACPPDGGGDITAPVLSAGSVSDLSTAAGTTATLKFSSDEAGTYYYVVLAASDAVPDEATVKAQGTAAAKGTDAATAAENTIAVTGLTPSSTYTAYIVVEDSSGNLSAILSISDVNPVMPGTPDTTAPVLSAGSVSDLSTPAGTTATLKFTSNEAGTYYYVVLAASDAAPNAATVKAQGTAIAQGTAAAIAAVNTIPVTGLTPSSTYTAYVVVEDAAVNLSTVLTINGVDPVIGTADVVVSALNLTALVTAPVKDATPLTPSINQTQYTGTIAWTNSSGTAHTSAFAASTVYKAVVTLTAQPGYTFTSVAANSFTYSGATVTNAADSGTVTITFPATAAAVVTALALDTLVTAPVNGATPDTSPINQPQYTGTIAWTNSSGTAHTSAFAASTVYKAVVTLTAQPGYTLTGLTASSFTYSGATSVTFAAGSGTVTITFPATAAGYTIANAASPDLKTKFGVGTASAAFTSLHNLISYPDGTDDFDTIIDLGDYIDLDTLTITGSGTITDAAITGGTDRGNLLRLIVVGKNSFKSGTAAANNLSAPNHVVFQFQNIPVTHMMNSNNSNEGGYKDSEMRVYLTNDFLPGLIAAGVPESVLWAPSRRVWNGYLSTESGSSSTNTVVDTIDDVLWLPTVYEMLGIRNTSSQREVTAGQAKLEYYDATNRIKYDSSSSAISYWTASPWSMHISTFCNVNSSGAGADDSAYESNGGCAPAFCVK
ncbi:hypothetical protein FACS189485_14980 [Spirochaetia bacterium]|nr:hypothetical protein FACS189485_14980 [Spirochaetia bacterium]